MNKFKKLISFVLASVCIVSAGACTNKAEETGGGGETVSLVWYYPGTAQADQDMVFEKVNEILKEKLNITVEPKVIDSGSYQEKMNMVIASNEDYDLCFTSNWTNKYLPNVLKKAYLPLNQLIDDNAPGLREALPDYVWDISRYGDDIYAVPCNQMIFYQPTLCVPTELYNKYKDLLQNIQKPEDLVPYLEAIKNNEPGYYPYRPVSAATWYDFEAIYGAEVSVMKNGDTTVFNPYTTEEYKNYIMLMSDWFKKGYIRKDVASITSDTDDIKNMKYAIWDTQYKPGLEYINVKGEKMDVTYLPMDTPTLSNGAGTQAMIAINAGSKHPVEAIKLIELLNTDKELYNLICYGIEGTHYEKTGENTIRILEGSKYSPKTDWEFGNQFNAYITEGKELNVWEETAKMNEEATPSKLFGFVFNPEPVKTEVANVSSVVTEYAYLEKGTENAEESYDTFLKKLESSGINKIIEEAQAQIDAWKQ